MYQTFRDLAAPSATIFAAVVAAFFVRRQALTALDQLRYNLSQKRFEIYDDVQSLIRLLLNDSHKEGFGASDVIPHYKTMREARFFFPDDICAWFDELQADCQRFLLAQASNEPLLAHQTALMNHATGMQARFEKELEFPQLTRRTRHLVNWKRGFIRLWIVLSVLWIGGAGWAFDPIQRVHEARAPALFKVGDDVIEFPSGTNTAIIRKALTDFVRSEATKTPPPVWAALDKVDTTVSQAIGDYRPARLWLVIASTTGMFIFPPIAALVAGFVIVWIVRGFRRL